MPVPADSPLLTWADSETPEESEGHAALEQERSSTLPPTNTGSVTPSLKLNDAFAFRRRSLGRDTPRFDVSCAGALEHKPQCQLEAAKCFQEADRAWKVRETLPFDQYCYRCRSSNVKHLCRQCTNRFGDRPASSG